MPWSKFRNNLLEKKISWITNKLVLITSSHSVGLPAGISDHYAVLTELDIDPLYHRTKPRECVSSKMLIGKLSGKKSGAAGPPFQKKVPAILLMKIG